MNLFSVRQVHEQAELSIGTVEVSLVQYSVDRFVVTLVTKNETSIVGLVLGIVLFSMKKTLAFMAVLMLNTTNRKADRPWVSLLFRRRRRRKMTGPPCSSRL